MLRSLVVWFLLLTADVPAWGDAGQDCVKMSGGAAIKASG
jgi:tetratricopeptide (TPR) repeat protein